MKKYLVLLMSLILIMLVCCDKEEKGKTAPPEIGVAGTIKASFPAWSGSGAPAGVWETDDFIYLCKVEGGKFTGENYKFNLSSGSGTPDGVFSHPIVGNVKSGDSYLPIKVGSESQMILPAKGQSAMELSIPSTVSSSGNAFIMIGNAFTMTNDGPAITLRHLTMRIDFKVALKSNAEGTYKLSQINMKEAGGRSFFCNKISLSADGTSTSSSTTDRFVFNTNDKPVITTSGITLSIPAIIENGNNYSFVIQPENEMPQTVTSDAPINFNAGEYKMIPLTYSEIHWEWELDFEDDFNTGTSPNTAHWAMYNSPGHAGNGLRRPSAYTIEDGNLVVTAKMVDGQIVSGGMAHKRNYLYGKFEFRVKTEKDPSSATSGVVLTWPQSEHWPKDGELDFYETGTGASRRPVHTFLHFGELKSPELDPENPNNYNDNNLNHKTYDIDGSEWHTWVAEWTYGKVVIYIDGVESYVCTNNIVANPHHLSIQLDAFKKTMGDPVKMYVDYVKIYKQKFLD